MRENIRVKIPAALLIVSLLAVTPTPPIHAAAPPFPTPVADDNADEAFVREAVPILLGRKPRGALEIKLLTDIAGLEGRESLLYTLMATPEYARHWSVVLYDLLRVQRGGQRRQLTACFGEQRLTDADGEPLVSRRLASQIASRSPDGDPVLSGDDFNMRDVLVSSLARDDLSVVMRAYLFPLGVNPGRGTRVDLGREFAHIYLNRNFGCMACHNEVNSVTGPASGWDRAFPIQIALDHKILGVSFGPPDDSNVHNLFRGDQRADLVDGSISDEAILPWGIRRDCVTDTYTPTRVGVAVVPASGNSSVSFAGIEGDDKAVLDLEDTLRDGVRRLKNQGLVLEDDPAAGWPVPTEADAALAFTVAAAVVDELWRDVFGRPLTIANYFPRNAAQRDALWQLTDEVFLPRWSLKSLLAAALLGGYANRRAPEDSLLDGPYKLPMIIDPWVARDPRLPADSVGDADDPALTSNGQGELVRKHDPQTLFQMAAAALGWPDPRPYGGFPADGIKRDIGAYWSQDDPGHEGFDMQSILAWEETYGTCSKPSGVTEDWIDRLMSAVEQHDQATPLLPLSLVDVIETLKDWIIQEGFVETGLAQDVPVSELEALAEVFADPAGTPLPLTTAASAYKSLHSEAKFESDVRQVCGVLLESPQFLLKGLSPNGVLEIPKLRVCNDDACSYREMCEALRPFAESAGSWIECLEDDVIPGEEPPAVDPFDTVLDLCRRQQGLCDHRQPPVCLDGILVRPRIGSIDPLDCPIDVPRCDPRCELGFAALEPFGGGEPDPFGGGELGLPCCGGLGPDGFLEEPLSDLILTWIEGAEVLAANDVLVYPLGGDRVTTLEAGGKLQFGQVLAVAESGRLRLRTRDNDRIELSAGGLARGALDRAERKIDRDLLDAVGRGAAKEVAMLLERGANPNAFLPGDRSALTAAVEIGDPIIVQRLVSAGAKTDRRDGRGIKPGDLASSLEKWDLAKLLGREAKRRYPKKPSKGTKERPAEGRPLLVMVTGPSAAKARHPLSPRYLSAVEAAARRLTVHERIKSLSIEDRLELLERWIRNIRPGEETTEPRKGDPH